MECFCLFLFCFLNFKTWVSGYNSFESDLQSVLDSLGHDVRDTTPIQALSWGT